MPEQTSASLVRQGSTLSMLWGILLIVFGILAIGEPFVAAIAINLVIAWLITFAGVVHLALAFHAHRASSSSGRCWLVSLTCSSVCT